MTVLEVPPLEPEGQEWPTLGPQVIHWIESNLVFGPGDLRGEPAVVDPEKRALLCRMYEVYPEGAVRDGKPIAGRRRFRRVALSLQKGTAKTEFAAWIAAAELHPDGPVRTAFYKGGDPIFGANGNPKGTGVNDPYIPMVAYTEEQTEELAYGALKAILENSRIARDFDIGLERILRRTGDGKATALAGSPNARDGARTTFQHEDETHRFTLPGLKRAHRTMIANLPKRYMADPWGLESTTSFAPGEGSVAEETAEYARAVAEGKVKDPSLFYFHRQASDDWQIYNPETGELQREQLSGAVFEACGPTASWRDTDGIIGQWDDPAADKSYLERVWLNRPTSGADHAFNASAWQRNRASDEAMADGKAPDSLITLGFDGSLYDDSTCLVATSVMTGLQWVVGWWEKPYEQQAWEVPREEVDRVVDWAFEQWEVWRMYADPSKWEADLARWAGRHGDKVVVSWPTTLYKKMATALKAYAGAIEGGEVLNDGDPRLLAHIGNARKRPLNFRDDDGSPLWLIAKERKDSPHKIDGAMAGCLSWQAHIDAVASGAAQEVAWVVR